MNKLLFSIPVHESDDCVNDMLDNIIYYNPDCYIILHLSYGFKYSLPTKYASNVFLNDICLRTGFMDGSLTIVHLSNYFYAKNIGLTYSFFIPFASNQMFFKFGLMSAINGYSSSSVSTPKVDDPQYVMFKRDSNLLSLLAAFQIKKSAPEGTFYSKDIIDNAVTMYRLDRWYANDLYCYTSILGYFYRLLCRNIARVALKFKIKTICPNFIFRFSYASEEIFFPTLFSSEVATDKYCFIPWDRKGLHIEISDFYDLLKSDNCFYSVKRIDRDINDPVRKYIKESLSKNYLG